ncbi:MAG TPA: hypothetical protein DEP45_03865 [Armatimonadetes bacterium]|nr:hypothetical protein [Armatimonadota bacterium]
MVNNDAGDDKLKLPRQPRPCRIGVEVTAMLDPVRTGLGHATRMLISAFAEAERELWLYWRHRPGLDLPKASATMHPRAVKIPVGYMTAGVPARLVLDRIEVCHFPEGEIPAFCPVRSIVTGYDLTWHVFAHVFEPARGAQLRDIFEPGLLKADHIIAISQNTRNDIMEVYGIAADRISVVPLAVDPDMHRASDDEIAAVRGRYGLERPYLLHTGTFLEHKNVEWLLRCYSRAFADQPDRPQLILAGPPLPRADEIVAVARSLEAAEDIRYLGYVPREDLPALMTAALAYVFPSLYEGFGLPPLEAMACGTPVISSMAGALSETIGDAAIVIDPTDDDMMIAALSRVIDDEGLRRDLVTRGYERVKLSTWARTAELTWAVYERVLGRSCAGNSP